MDKLQWAQWFIDHGVAIFPVEPQGKRAIVKEWQKYSTTPLSDEEKVKYLEMIEKGYNYAVPGGQHNLVILDFENKELLKAWIGENALNELCGKTLCVNTPHLGLHIYVIADEIPSRKFNPFFVKENKSVADLQSFNSYVVGPESSINHKHCDGDKCPWKGQDYTTRYTPYNYNEIGRVNLKEFLNFLVEKGKKLGIELSSSAREWLAEETRRKTEEPRRKSLSESDILKIIDILTPIFKQGQRHELLMYLTGWLYKARISYESAKELIESICNKFGDNECKDRLYTLDRTYGFAGNQPPEDRLKTTRGIYELLSSELGEADALGRIRQLEEILETAEPRPKILIELLNYEREIYAITHFTRGEVLTATRKNEENKEKLIYKDRVIIGCPESVTAVMTPFSQLIKYDVVWNIPSQKRKLSLEGVTVDEILAYLKANGLVLKKNQAEDVLNAILNAMLRKGLANIKTGFEAPGFYWVDGKIIANKIHVKKPETKELKEALELLNELVDVWFTSVKEQFVTAIKIGLLMPFDFAVKQKFKSEKGFLPWLYLHGRRDTGKTTTAEIILYIYDIANRLHELGGGEVDTEAKLGAMLSSDTLPHIVNEGGTLFDKPHLSEIIKQAVEGLIARQRFENKTIIKEYPAFAPLIITANELRITDEALTQKRLIVLRYPVNAKVSKERIAEFREKVSQRLPRLKALGQFVEWYLIEHPEELKYDWINLSRKLLEKAYEWGGITPTFDLGIQYVDTEENDPRLDIIAILWKKIVDTYNKRVEVTYDNGSYVVVTNPLGILESVLESKLLDFMLLKSDEVVFTSKVLQILRDEGVNIDSMASFAEFFADYGFTYGQKWIMGKNMKVLSVKREDFERLIFDFFNQVNSN